MDYIRNWSMVLIAAAAVLSGSVAADPTADVRTNPASPPSTFGIIESIGLGPARSEAPGAVVAGLSAGGAVAGQHAEKSQSTSARFAVRVRLDDGRYLGFHQDGGDELRVGDRVQIELDRLRRVQEQGKAGQ